MICFHTSNQMYVDKHIAFAYIICTGPELGMEYMHGVLMHGDDDTGDDHKNEDTYLRLQAIDEEKAKQTQNGVGPCKGKYDNET